MDMEFHVDVRPEINRIIIIIIFDWYCFINKNTEHVACAYMKNHRIQYKTIEYNTKP